MANEISLEKVAKTVVKNLRRDGTSIDEPKRRGANKPSKSPNLDRYGNLKEM